MSWVSGNFTEVYANFLWLHFICDTAIIAGSLLIACLIGYTVHRLRLVFLGCLVLCALSLGLYWPTGTGPSLLALCLGGMAKAIATVLLWASAIVFLGLLRQKKHLPPCLALGGELEQETAKRRQAEVQLQESENRWRTIFDNARDVITYVDTHGRIIDVNKRVEDVFGYKPEELIGKRFTKLGILRLTDIPRIAWLFRRTLREGQATEIVELELKHKNGGSVYLEVGTRFVRRNGKIKEVVNIFRDISERKQTMAELTAAKQTAEAANRAKSE
ncbi:MAG: PAS domain-containing protein, partial [Thermoguttaceae bacterium]